jgi:uncharacterized protein
MERNGIKYYPGTLDAIHLLVLYIVLQSMIDFPLALYDYHHDTNWLAHPWISFVSNMSITLFIFYFAYRKANQPFRQVFALRGFNPLLLVPILIILPAMQYLVGLLNVKVDQLLPAPPWFWELFERIFDSRFGFWGAALKVVLIAPVVEEILFRGIIMHGLMRNNRSWVAVLLSGILFSAFHLNPWQMTYTFFLGLLLGWIMVKTRSLPLAILVHALNNLLVLLSITYHEFLSKSILYNINKTNSIVLASLALFTGIAAIVWLTRRKKFTKNKLQTTEALD